MLKYNEVNPLAVFGIRRVEHCPPHFTKVEFDLRTMEKNISDWIWANLSGRFFYGDLYYSSDAGSVAFHKCVAFEIPGEASMFSLILDQINKSDFNLSV
jgi:hypothetical protein